MKLSKSQEKLLNGIQAKLKRGDITAIAKKIKVSKEYVGMVLNPKSEFFREDIVLEAIEIIAKHEQSTKNLLEKLSEVA